MVHGLLFQAGTLYVRTPLGDVPVGRDIEMQVASGYIQWRHAGELTWQNLLALSTITGPAGEPGLQGPPGQDGTGVTILGSFNTLAELQAAHPTGNVGDAYLVGGTLFVWSATDSEWVGVGDIRGPQGEPGPGVDMRVESNILQWRRQGQDTWYSLPLDFSDPRFDGLSSSLSTLQGMHTSLATTVSNLATAVANQGNALTTLENDFDTHVATNVLVV